MPKNPSTRPIPITSSSSSSRTPTPSTSASSSFNASYSDALRHRNDESESFEATSDQGTAFSQSVLFNISSSHVLTSHPGDESPALSISTVEPLPLVATHDDGPSTSPHSQKSTQRSPVSINSAKSAPQTHSYSFSAPHIRKPAKSVSSPHSTESEPRHHQQVSSPLFASEEQQTTHQSQHNATLYNSINRQILDSTLPMHLLRPIILPSSAMAGLSTATAQQSSSTDATPHRQPSHFYYYNNSNSGSSLFSTSGGSNIPSPANMYTFYQILRQHPQITYKFVLSCAKRCCGSSETSSEARDLASLWCEGGTSRTSIDSVSKYAYATQSIGGSVRHSPSMPLDPISSIGSFQTQSPHSSYRDSLTIAETPDFVTPTHSHTGATSSAGSHFHSQPRIDLLLRIFKYFLNVHVFSVVEPDIDFLMELDQFVHSGVSQKHISLKKYLAKLNAQIRICVEHKSPRDQELWKKYLESVGVKEKDRTWEEHIISLKDVEDRRSITMQHPDLVFGVAMSRSSQMSMMRRSTQLEKRRELVKDFCDFRSKRRGAFISASNTSHSSSNGNVTAVNTSGPSALDSLSTNTSLSATQNEESLKAFVTRKRSLLDSLHFGAQFRQIAKFEDKMPEIDMSESIVMENVHTIYRHISGVAEAKQFEDSDNESDLSSNDGALNNTADRDALNHSRVFEKIPLEQEEITIDEVDATLDILVDPHADLQHYMEATHLVLKLLGKVFWNYDLNEIYESQFFFMEILQSESEKIRGHAFDLLYNLYLHLKSNSLKSNDSPSASRYIPHLCDFLRNMCLHIYLDDESHEEVWRAAHACFLELVVPLYEEVIQFDVRVIEKFVEMHMYVDENQHRHLLRILVNLLYFSKVGSTTMSSSSEGASSLPANPPAELNLFLLHQIGGIEFILEQYMVSHSFEARNNLFVVIYDYVVYQVNSASNRRVFKKEHVESLFLILLRADAPQYLYQLFCYTSSEFASQFAKFIYANLVLVQSRNFENSAGGSVATVDYKHLGESRTFMSLIIRFSVYLGKLAARYLRLEEEFYAVYQQMMEQNEEERQEDIDQFLEHIRSLLTSLDPDEKRNGKALLFLVMKNFDSLGIESMGHKKLHEQLDDAYRRMCFEAPQLRLAYLDVFERMLYYHRSKYQAHGDEKFHAPLMKHLNEGLLRFVSSKRQPAHLLLKAFYILMDFISIYYTPPGNLTHPLENEIPFAMNPGKREMDIDTLPSMFLGGHMAIPYFLLKDISIGILHNIFVCMTEAVVMESISSTLEKSIERARCVLFVLMIQKCSRKPSVLASLGGVAFFKNMMLDDNNPGVAYFAAEYLIRVLVDESKDEYYEFLKRIIREAHETNDAYLLDNPYLQVCKLVLDE